MPIVTLSNEISAGGSEIGQKLAERLGLHYVDQELISEAALRYGFEEEKLSIDAAVELIAGVLQRSDMATTPASQQIVADRALASRVQVALATHPKTQVPDHGGG